MGFELLEIPGLKASEQTRWKIRALALDGRSPALGALLEWQESEKADFKKIMKVLRMLGQVPRVHDEKKVKKSSNPDHEGTYEARADKGHARLMFFYCEEDESLVICTNHYWKGRGNQNMAFKQCSDLRTLYLKSRP